MQLHSAPRLKQPNYEKSQFVRSTENGFICQSLILSLSTLSFVDFDSVSILKQFWQYPIQIQYESVYTFAT